jgi:sugar/nucleoside kinase (ribokinase family)
MASKKFNVVAAGRAYTDMVAHVNPEFLHQHRIPADGQRECTLEEISQIQADLPEWQMLAGGPSSNTCAVISALGGSAGFFGKVYRDLAGEFFLEDARQRNILFCCYPYANKAGMTGTCLVLLTEQQRSFAYNTGCSNNFSIDDFKEFDFSLADFFLLEAHLLTHPDAHFAIKKALYSAKHNVPIVINLHGITIWNNHNDVVKLIAANADIIVGNSLEQHAFRNAASELKKLSGQLIITTKGEGGADAFQSDVAWHTAAKSASKLVSTAGAGDAFIAGFLLALSKGANVQDSLSAAVDAATWILAETGARPSLTSDNRTLHVQN